MSRTRPGFVLATWVITALAANGAAPATVTQVSVDPFCRRSISGISELNRAAYFSLCDEGTGFDRRAGSVERLHFLLQENSITFGRRLNVVSGLAAAVREDPERPGFADLAHLQAKLASRRQPPGELFRALAGGRLDIAAHENHNAFPPFMGRYSTPAAATAAKPDFLPEKIAAAAELTAAVLERGYTDFDRPRYYELLNEPHWSYWKTDHLARWHLATQAAIKRRMPDVLVGGPCLPVAYFYRQQFTAFSGLREFIDQTGCRLDFYSFHCYDFLREKDGDFGGRITSGLPLEGVLDLVQAYTTQRYGRTVGLVVSEHGGYGAPELVEKLARAHIPGSGFDWEMKRRSIDDFNMVSSAIANTLVFLDHPATVWKAVPFILLDATRWDPRYYAVLYTPRDYAPRGEWVPTKKIHFYEFFRDLQGRRVAAACADPDVQARGFVHGSTLRVVLHNLSRVPKLIQWDLPHPQSASLRRFGRNSDFTPYLREEPCTPAQTTTLAPREAIMLIAGYEQPIAVRADIEESTSFAARLPTAGRERDAFSLAVPDGLPIVSAMLRIGVSRPADAGWELAVSLNGTPLVVPLEACAERLVEQEYASCKLVPVDPLLLLRENVVEIAFPDGRPGSLGAVALRVARRNPAPRVAD